VLTKGGRAQGTPAVSKISGKKKKTEKRKKYKLWARRVLTKGGRAQGTPAVSKISGKKKKNGKTEKI